MMKKNIFTILILLGSFFVNAQDKIIKASGDTISGKVIEIGQTELKYKKSSNLDGPTYVISKASVNKIIYENGDSELYTTKSTPKTYSSPGKYTAVSEEIVIRKYKYYYKGRGVSKRKLQELLISAGDLAIIEEYERSKTAQTTAYVLGFGAPLPSIIGAYASFSSITPFWVGIVVTNAMLVANNVLRHVYKNKRNHAVRMYNTHIQQSSKEEDYY
jgi:hypothetical protein